MCPSTLSIDEDGLGRSRTLCMGRTLTRKQTPELRDLTDVAIAIRE